MSKSEGIKPIEAERFLQAGLDQLKNMLVIKRYMEWLEDENIMMGFLADDPRGLAEVASRAAAMSAFRKVLASKPYGSGKTLKVSPAKMAVAWDDELYAGFVKRLRLEESHGDISEVFMVTDEEKEVLDSAAKRIKKRRKNAENG